MNDTTSPVPSAAPGRTIDEIVLVTGAGTPAGIGMIRALAGRAEVVAVDVDPLAPGFDLATSGALVPSPQSAGYAESVAAVAMATGATVLLSSDPAELPALRSGAAFLDAVGLRRLLPTAEAVSLCFDGLRFAEALAIAGLPTATTLLGSPDGSGPWMVGPRVRRPGSAVLLVDDRSEAEELARRLDEPVFRQRVPGRRFTVDGLATADGLVGGVARWRVPAADGLGERFETFTRPAVVGTCSAAVRALGLEGPASIDGVVTDDGDVVVIEVDPSFSRGLAVSQRAGADLVGAYVTAACGSHVAAGSVAGRPGVVMRADDEIAV